MSAVDFDKFVSRPTLSQYRALRNQTLASWDYDPQALVLAQLHDACHQQEWEQAIRIGLAHRLEYQISPRFHFLLGQAYEVWGDLETVSAARAAFRSCLSMLLATGSGTLQAPRTATFVTDINDVALALRLEVRCRETLQRGSRMLDLVTDVTGQQIYFDVTDMMRRVPVLLRQRSASKV